MGLAHELGSLFERDLEHLQIEADAYAHEEQLWQLVEGIRNSGGNLILHICGNLQHYIGANLGESGYERDRAFEFSGRVTRGALAETIDITRHVVLTYLADVSEQKLSEPYTAESFDHPMTTSHFLIHLYGHMRYHLGQINYHRRMV